MSATILSLFARHASLETTALAAGGASMSYRELETRSNEIADALWSRGVRVEEAVILSAERSIETIPALLGILKCGAFYVPVDARWPALRLRHIAAQTAARFALFAEDAPPCGVAAMRIAELRGAAPRPPLVVDPDNLAYVMFTSGSTGVPKAIGVPHRAVARLAHEPRFVRVAGDDVFLWNAPLGFDASTFEIWTPLVGGCRLEIAPPGALSPRELARVVRDRGVTILWLTAGLFTRVVDDACDLLAGLRALLAGGDVLPPRAVRTALAKLPATRLINGYGPTENTTFTCCHTIAEAPASIPIGTAISGTYVRIVDRELRPVPRGGIGELVTGGDGLARGYHRDPRRTAAAFVPDAQSAVPGARVYRTGDLVRERDDGAIEFHGRADDQVKLSGYRIEPAEVAHVMGSHPAISIAAVAVRNARLVAWYQALREVSSDELAAFLADRLPPYMIPAQFVRVDAMPLSEQGKVDRAALPDPLPVAGSADAPSSTLDVLASIWREVLGIGSLPEDAEFFRCGGDSLTATQVVGRVRARFGAEIPLSRFFENPTLHGLASLVDASSAESRLPAPSTFPAGSGPLTFPQERVWFLQQLEPESLAYQFQATIRFRGPLDVAALRVSLRRIVERHEIYRTTFPADDEGRPLQIVHP
ncbi:MAG TPA: amino acid adenylation domain-containing protein, partial [Thermoanaerobaculia bacterium]|nr:amino acid adenylation domain-containing protein [Thermoanaerobaculia bacterium]